MVDVTDPFEQQHLLMWESFMRDERLRFSYLKYPFSWDAPNYFTLAYTPPYPGGHITLNDQEVEWLSTRFQTLVPLYTHTTRYGGVRQVRLGIIPEEEEEIILRLTRRYVPNGIRPLVFENEDFRISLDNLSEFLLKASNYSLLAD